MENTKEIAARIEILRNYLYELVNTKRSLTDMEVIMASAALDRLINRYNKEQHKSKKQ